MKRWTTTEDDLLRQWWPIVGMRACDYIPGRTGDACKVRACLLGLPSRRKEWRPKWTRVKDPTPEEIRERAALVRAGKL